MVDESIDNVLNKFPPLDGAVKLLSDEELQNPIVSRLPQIRKTKHQQINELWAFDIKKEKYILCGHLVGAIFYRDVKAEHYIRMIGGYGIQEDAFQLLVARGYKHIVFRQENGDQLISPIDEWLRPSIRVKDLGHGNQRLLPDKYMTCVDK